MALPYLGKDATIGVGAESTWGTAVARARWERLRQVTLHREDEFAPIPDLGDNGTSLVPTDSFQVSENVVGNVEINVSYDGYVATTLLYHAMGGLSTSGAGPYVHTLTLASALPTGLTIEAIKGSGHGEVYEGCKVNRLTLGVAVGEVMRMTAEIIGETSGGQVSVASPTLTTPTYAIHHQAGLMTINSVTYRIKSFELVIDNKLTRRDGLGLNTTLEPARGDKTAVSCRVTVERVSNALETLYQAGTKADASITFTSGSKSIAITLQNALISSYDCPVSRVGPLEETIELVGYRSASKTGLEVVWTNANTATI